jgi:uncharacterized protein YcbK (DUF882 family)
MMEDQLYSYIKTTSVKRWEFFSEDELRCKGTDELDMDEEFMKKLIALRKQLNQYFKIISGYRHMAYNDILGKNRDSPHLLGKAVDIACHGRKAYNIIRIGIEHGFTGIGVKQHGEKEDRFVHLDTMSNGERSRPMFWSYK